MPLDNVRTKKAMSLMPGVLSRVVLPGNKICLLLLSCGGRETVFQSRTTLRLKKHRRHILLYQKKPRDWEVVSGRLVDL